MFAVVDHNPPAPPQCRNCRDPRKKVNRPRGLCWDCYYSPGVRDRFVSVSGRGRRGVGNITRGGFKLAPTPTPAAPGTEEKLAVMEARAAAGFAIFHPADARYPGDPRTLAFLARAAA